MGKHHRGWPEAKKLCRLSQNDVTMARSLGFQPDALLRARPDPKQKKWKLSVKDWIHELHLMRFGYVLGEKPHSAPQATTTTPEEAAEAARLYGEEVYWEDYWERNQETLPRLRQLEPSGEPIDPTTHALDIDPITDDDVPF
jgi:hypothetical protein